LSCPRPIFLLLQLWALTLFMLLAAYSAHLLLVALVNYHCNFLTLCALFSCLHSVDLSALSFSFISSYHIL
jgi:hypothetical protein